MIRATKIIHISEEKLKLFIENATGTFNVDGQILKKKQGSSILFNNEIKIWLKYDEKKKTPILTYESNNSINDEVELFYYKKGIEKGVKGLLLDSDETPYSKKKIIRIIILMAIFFALIGFTFNFIFSSWDDLFYGFSLSFTEANAWTTFLFLKIITGPLIEAVILILVLRIVFDKKEVKLLDVMFAYSIAFFLDTISPFWGPGSVFVVWFLNKRTESVKLSEFVMSMMLWGLLVNTFVTIYSFIIIPVANQYLGPKMINNSEDFAVLIGLSWGGVAFLTVNVVFFTMLGIFEWFQKFMIGLIVLILKLFGQSKRIETIKHELLFQGKRFKKAYKISFSKWYLSFILLIIWFIAILHSTLLQYSGMQTVALGEISFLDALFVNSIMLVANTWIPIPGNIGVSEYYLIIMIENLLLDANYCPSANDCKIAAEQITIIYRSLHLYLPMFLGGVFFIGTNIFFKKTQKKKDVKWLK